MKVDLKIIIKQALSFFVVSGIGWLIDMTIFSFLSRVIAPTYANIISSSVSVTYVYIVSTKKIFRSSGKYSLKTKYVIYIIYQIFIILLSSLGIGYLSNLITKTVKIKLILNNAKICAKILVTPFTMTMNFTFMKVLMEKIK